MQEKLDVRKIFRDFMVEKGFLEIPNVSLVPENDPTLLFVNSGMFPLGKYLRGEVKPPSSKLFNIQKCVRFDDIEEVGDDRHTSFFHMMGDWSIGDFFKETQIPMMSEFLFEKIKIDPKRFYVTVFEGNEFAPRDEESISLWKEVFKKHGVHAEVSDITITYSKEGEEVHAPDSWNIGENSSERIFAYPMKKNWWQRGHAPGELGGPDTEMFYDTGRKHDMAYGKICHLNCDCGRFIEIGNNVFMQYSLDDEFNWQPLPQKNVDFGGGLERFAMAAMHESDIFMTDEFLPIIKKLENISGKKYSDNKKYFQIISDHMRAATFIIADGIFASNKDQGYILRRLIRRAVRSARNIGIENTFARSVIETIITMFAQDYPYLEEKKDHIIDEVEKEEKKFSNTLSKGLRELERIVFASSAVQKEDAFPETKEDKIITSEQVFNLYQTYGFPVEMTLEEVKNIAKDKGLEFESDELLIEVKEFIKKHQELSRAGSEQKFKGGLADTADETTRLHTTAHLFLEAARRVLGEHVHQRGSNITAERIRFDFSHPQKLTPEEIKKIEDIVNEQIDLELDREVKEYNTDEAFSLGAEGEFREKYGDKVNVYKFSKPLSEIPADKKDELKREQFTIGINKAIESNAKVKDFFKDEYVYSFEICGGPHVNNTREIKQVGKFKITKEESSSSGVRRIKAELIK